MPPSKAYVSREDAGNLARVIAMAHAGLPLPVTSWRWDGDPERLEDLKRKVHALHADRCGPACCFRLAEIRARRES